jgi:soluble lytic murein transglycosylase
MLTAARTFSAALLIAVVSANSSPVVRLARTQVADLQGVHEARAGHTKVVERTDQREAQNLWPSHFFTRAEQAQIKAALQAAARHEWQTARRLAGAIASPLPKKLIEWRYLLDQSSRPPFREINQFLVANPGWPRRAVLLLRAETSMPGNVDAKYVVNWFGKRRPISGYGQIRLGEAEIAVGRSAVGQDRIRRAWVENAFDPATEKRILRDHRDLFTAQLQQERLARLLLKQNFLAGSRQLPRVQAPAQLVLNARMLLQPRSKSGSILSIAQRKFRDNPRLLLVALKGIDEHSPLIARDRLWPTIKVAAREAIAGRDYSLAYQLVSHSGLQSGADYVEAEFMAGWLALEYLKQPEKALEHFGAVRREATLPATISRAEYWLGRACDGLSDSRLAMNHYRQAAQKGVTFYGQLATVRLNHAPTLRLKTVKIEPSVAKLSLRNDRRAEAARILSAIGEHNLAREFALQLVEENHGLNRLAAVIGLAQDLHDPALSLRVAKEAERRNLLLLEYLHPVVHIPQQTQGHPPDPAVVLSIIRQESEFDPFAESNAGARGLMQLLPSTAKEAAERQHIGFDAESLGKDGDYNIQLGESTFASYMRFWSNSVLLAVASYNAGPGTVRKWVAAFGDPRNGHVDPVDWIESIPFDETRTYVQRVLAGTQVYRNRLRAKDVPLKIVADLRDSGVHVSNPAQKAQVQLAAD